MVMVPTNSVKGLFGSFVRARGATKWKTVVSARNLDLFADMCKNGRKAILAFFFAGGCLG